MNNLSNVSGLLLIDKDSGMTSFDVIRKLKKIYNTDKIGHTGTLDPLATGLLCVLIGPSVKLSDMLMNGTKVYYAGLKLGKKTDTQDILGNITETNETIPSNDKVFDCINSFKGEYYQIPPMYSAKKKNGKKLYDYARSGENIEREANKLNIYSIILDKENSLYPYYYFTVECSKGTYVRTLCDDIGSKIGTFGCMSSLRRIRCSQFNVVNSYKLSTLENMDEDELQSIVISPEKIFNNFGKVKLSEFYTKLILNGCEIYQNKIGTNFKINENVLVYSNSNVFLGIGCASNYEYGSAIKLKIRL